VTFWSGARDLLRRIWARWLVIAHIIGNFQARVLLTIFYFLIVPPFALVAKAIKDPLGLHLPRGESYWIPRSGADPAAARRQF